MAIKKLLFIDTNIWLDFYRARNEISLELLEDVEKISDSVIISYQLEAEFKKNRQTAILEGMKELDPPSLIPRLGIFSDSSATKKVTRGIKDVQQSVKTLRSRLRRALEDPSVHDPVYKVCQRIFHKNDEITLTHQDKIRHTIRRLAFRRFLHGCPPRKKTDSSIGDALNWEWMLHCAKEHKAELVIVSRDSDYGVTFENRSYINDHLRQEFHERVSRKRHVMLYAKLSQALQHFDVPVSEAATKAESDLVSAESSLASSSDASLWADMSRNLDRTALERALSEQIRVWAKSLGSSKAEEKEEETVV